MRLIDADALKQECMYIDDIPTVTERDIDNAPTIDAIPVEWLKQWRDKLKGMGEYQRERAEDISFVLGLWKKGQGAR